MIEGILLYLHFFVLSYAFYQFFVSDQTIFVVFLAYLAATSLLKELESNGNQHN